MSDKKTLSILMAVVSFAFLSAAKSGKNQGAPNLEELKGKDPTKKACKCGKSHNHK